MDAERFDHVSKLVNRDPTRRQMLGGLLGGVLTALALAPAAAKKKGKKGKKKKGGDRVCAAATGDCPSKCEFDLQCGLRKICKDNKCVPGCRSDNYCPVLSATEVEVCEDGQCVPGCLDNNFQCPQGKICAEDHHCVPGCRAHSDCPDCHLCDIEGTWQCYVYDPFCCLFGPGC